jgi:hypothetical protein
MLPPGRLSLDSLPAGITDSGYNERGLSDDAAVS